jgi:hypothetical protein
LSKPFFSEICKKRASKLNLILYFQFGRLRKIMPKLKLLSVVTLAFLFMFACGNKSSETSSGSITQTVQAEPTPPKTDNKEPITIAAAGDVMLGSTFPIKFKIK